jgi:hypothetical protein
MVRNYNLKNEITSPKKIQRLLKKISDNAVEDRNEAQDLLSKVKTALNSFLENPPETDEGEQIIGGDSFHKLIQSAVLALNQAGIANERLLKLASLLQKYVSGKEKGVKGADVETSLFNTIKELASSNDEED